MRGRDAFSREKGTIVILCQIRRFHAKKRKYTKFARRTERANKCIKRFQYDIELEQTGVHPGNKMKFQGTGQLWFEI